MIKSMTGFGRAETSDEKRNIICEIRSVNHRYCDITVKMPRRYSFAEEKIKAEIKKVVSRGKLDVSINVENLAESDVTVKLNELVARQYMDNLGKLAEDFGLSGDITLEYLASLPDVMKAVPDVDDEEEITAALLVPVYQAALNLDEMRIVEGKKLAEDLLMRGELIRGLVDKIEEVSPRVVEDYKEKLRERIAELIGGQIEVPEERILTEAAIFADKSNITEELVRLDSHMIQLGDIINAEGEPAGKKLDFLVQEMNRESNTIGSKANFLEITSTVLTIKSEIEKIREQIQNVE